MKDTTVSSGNTFSPERLYNGQCVVFRGFTV